MRFQSHLRSLGHVQLPDYSGVRVMMMPFLFDQPRKSLPSSLAHWRELIARLVAQTSTRVGVGYLTIDESHVPRGRTQRRPGLHVDGGRGKGWGGGGGGAWGKSGFVLASSHGGCSAWHQEFEGEPGIENDCEHLRDQLKPVARVRMQPSVAYVCSPLCVHEATPLDASVFRQFVRISLPSDAPWYEGYTRNPLGIEPAGKVLPAREEFMGYNA